MAPLLSLSVSCTVSLSCAHARTHTRSEKHTNYPWCIFDTPPILWSCLSKAGKLNLQQKHPRFWQSARSVQHFLLHLRAPWTHFQACRDSLWHTREHTVDYAAVNRRSTEMEDETIIYNLILQPLRSNTEPYMLAGFRGCPWVTDQPWLVAMRGSVWGEWAPLGGRKLEECFIKFL